MAKKEYIERGALIAEIDRNEPSNWTDTEAEIQSILDYRLYKGIAISQPAADVVEVRHGEWERVRKLNVAVNPYQHTCGLCGKSYFDHNKFNYPFCPHCGAEMDGERKEQV